MTTVNIAQGNDRSLPQALMTAQAAIHLPEVQEMLRRLSEYKLGIFMPHMHDESTGNSSYFPITSFRWNPAWRYPSSHWMNSQTSQIASFLWGGFGLPVDRYRWQCARWSGKEQRTLQTATSNIKRVGQTSGA